MTISRFPFEAHIADMPPQHQYVIRNLWNVASDLQTAIPLLKNQIDTNTSSVKTVTETVNNNTSTESVTQVVSSSSTIGGVNNQTGNVTYSTAQADNGYFILFEDASPVAVSLTGAPVIQLPWSCVIINFGIGLVTATPASGTITYPNNLAAASIPISEGQAAIISFDGTNYWTVIIPVSPQDTPAVLSEWLKSYDAVTGLFTQTQPAFTDISGVASPSQLPTPTATTIGAVESIGPIASQWINEIDTSGVPHLSQPSFADISGTPSTTQVPFQSLTTTGAGAATLGSGVLNIPTPVLPLTGTTGSLGGSPMTVGQTITVTAAVTGATTSMVSVCSPVTYPGDGFVWNSYISASDVVTVCLTCVAIGTPTASVYQVRVVE